MDSALGDHHVQGLIEIVGGHALDLLGGEGDADGQRGRIVGS